MYALCMAFFNVNITELKMNIRLNNGQDNLQASDYVHGTLWGLLIVYHFAEADQQPCGDGNTCSCPSNYQ